MLPPHLSDAQATAAALASDRFIVVHRATLQEPIGATANGCAAVQNLVLPNHVPFPGDAPGRKVEQQRLQAVQRRRKP
ncbi:hypothetical protein LCGC14_2933390, partial [marine sediment metagenome]